MKGILAAWLLCTAVTAFALDRPQDPTAGGAGGRVVRVTTLTSDGPGSLSEAVNQSGARIIVFEVGGAIDFHRSRLTISEPYVTIAGQTAPSPGITLIRGGIDVRTHDVILSHVTVLAGADGQPIRSGYEPDAFSTIAGHHVVVEHCTFLWGVDENMSASGPRFDGEALDDWRRNTSHDIVFRLNLAAEGLSNSSHSKGEHSKGSLVHDNATGIVFDRNVWAWNMQRSPLVKGGAQVLMVNNVIHAPGIRAVHYNLLDEEWVGHAPVTGRLTAVGNVLRAGVGTDPGVAFLMIGGVGDLDYFGKDNLALSPTGGPLPTFGRYREGGGRVIERDSPTASLAGYEVLPTAKVVQHVLKRVGARPWDRGVEERRIIENVESGRGQIIDDEKQVGGYPAIPSTHAPFREYDWNLDTMKPKNGRYPGATRRMKESPAR